MSDTRARGLSPAQVEQFHDQGWLLVEDLFSDDDLQPLIDEIDEVIDQHARRLTAEGTLSRPYDEEGFETRLTRITAETEAVYWQLAGGKHCGAAMFDLIRHSALLDVAESLVGHEIVASSAYRIRPKVPGFGHGVVPWHQDSGYFEPACDRALILTVWLPLVDATPENGCLQVIGNCQNDDVIRHYQADRYLAIQDELLPLESTVTVPVPKGGVLLLSNRTPHCSTPNETDIVRWSVDIRYQGANAPSPALPAEMREEAVAATRERVELPELPLSCYAPEADFLVRSRRHREAVVTTWEEFHRIRTQHTPGAAPGRWREPAAG